MDDLSRKIEQREYAPGDKLPPESGLMCEQGVSRTVIREAISRLQAAGLVETRHGIGALASHGDIAQPGALGCILQRTGTGTIFTASFHRPVTGRALRSSLESVAHAGGRALGGCACATGPRSGTPGVGKGGEQS